MMADEASMQADEPRDRDSQTEAGPADDARPDDPDSRNELNFFPVVGVGASAGGLEAFEALLRHLPAELGDGQWNRPELRRLLEEIVPENTEIEGFEIVHDFPDIGRKQAVLDARRIEQEGDRPHLILLTVRELNDA